MQFTIDNDHNIQTHPHGAPDDRNIFAFKSAAALAQFPGGMEPIWNSFAGVAPFSELKPIKKFTSRKIGAQRIWDAIQRLAEAPKPDKAANVRAPRPRVAAGAPKPGNTSEGRRAGTQKAKITELISRKGGATLPELMQATGWQAHSIRGAIATFGTKGALKITSSKNAAGERVYEGHS
jgi:hypothetical protein